MKISERYKVKVKQLKTEVAILYLACKHPKTPWYAKVFAVCVAGYALSPIDLIPDFIPVLGYLDDLIIVSFGILIAKKMIPAEIQEECKRNALSMLNGAKNAGRVAAGIILLIWIIILGLTINILLHKT